MKKIIIVCMLFTIFALCISCGKKDVVQYEESSETNVENQVESYELAQGMEMPNVVVETNKGTTFDLSRIDKPVLINFWATWCPPCREEMPSLQNLYEQYGQKMDFILIDLGETKEAVQDFLIENEIYTFPIGYDTADVYSYKFNIMGIPTTCIVGKDKKIRNYIVGMRTEDQYREYIENAINEQ